MMHLRLIVPPESEQRVREHLDSSPGVVHIAVLAGSASRPEGRVILCDVVREAAEELLAELRALGLDQGGVMVMTDAGLVLSEQADRAEAETPGEGADAVLWESVVGITHEESTLSGTYLTFMSVATMLAACGVLLDNSILIVGAMVVGPDFGPLAGVCVAIVRRLPRAMLRSLTALVAGFLAAMATTWLFTLLMDGLGLFTRAQFEAPRPATAFIWQPDAFSVVVAALAGIVGMLSLTSAKSAALVGVAISVTTVPAAANAAVGLAYGAVDQAWGSFVQLGINLAGIMISGSATLFVQQRMQDRVRRRALRTG
ncbi:DUF389 domain-containing protein [Streptacidiphilus albus]|uniref:DUF389 domain-containing protein n=1 Tax=Streptacidiphilus albus TaxID=105425 RepID=UPI00054BB4FB|nr:DUF389 domain-containing protein [Streptacidiphilus albus]